jgi:hypothetical protein
VAALPPPAGTEVFTEDFNQGSVNSGLDDLVDVQGAEFSRGFHSPGVYHFRLSQPDERRWVVLPRLAYTNFSMQIELWDNSDNFIGSVAQGLIFRVQDNDHFYALLFNPRDRHYSVLKQEGEGNWSELLPRKEAPLLKQKNDHNQVRLDAAGDTFTIYLNGALLVSFQDPTYSFGMVGMISANEDAVEPHMHFDNLTIWSSDTPAPDTGLAPVRENAAGSNPGRQRNPQRGGAYPGPAVLLHRPDRGHQRRICAMCRRRRLHRTPVPGFRDPSQLLHRPGAVRLLPGHSGVVGAGAGVLYLGGQAPAH